MNHEERIAQLEAALALERAKVHELSAALATAVASAARVQQLDAERKARRSEQNRKAYTKRQQPIQHEIQRAESGAESGAESSTDSPSPSLPPPSSSPSLPTPISPPPISSPIPSSPPSASQAPVASAPSQGELVKSPKRTTAAEEFRDWARIESRKVLPPDAPDNCSAGGGMWPRLGKALKEQGMAKMQAAYRLFLADAYWKGQGLPLTGFVAKWEQFAGRVSATPARQPGLPKADDPDWETV